MRLFTLSSLALASVVVGLVALAPVSAAAAAAAAGKRVAKRAGAASTGEAPRVLPAPLPKAEVLPPLPPVARDVTAITTVTSAPVGEGTTTPAVSGATEALPALPAAAPAVGSGAGSPARDVALASPGAPAVNEVKPSGFVLDFGVGALVPATSFVSGVGTLGPGVSFDARLGYYVTPHVGFVVGVRGSYGHQAAGCGGDSCDGYSLQAPVMVQFAGTDRTRGVYAEIGIGLGTTYGASTEGAVYTLSSPAELKLGLGYRLAGAGGARRSTTLDFNVGADIGEINSADIHTGAGSYTGSVDGTTHVVVAVSLISHFSF